jgi:hypothetical protein
MLTNSANTNNKKVKDYILTVKRSLKEKYGRIDPAWQLMIDLLEDQLLLYYDFREKLHNGEELKFSETKSFREILASILKLSQKLGISSPYDFAKVKVTEKKEEQPDYIDELND